MPIANHNPLVGIPTQEQIDNFNKKIIIDEVSGCHIWDAAKCFHLEYPGDLSQAQGKFRYNDRTVTAYRFAMFLELGNQDPGPTVDHLCHNRICVNPLHLRCIPQIENNRARRCVISDYCQNGHIRDDKNLYIDPTTGNRRCRECARLRDKKRYQSKYDKVKSHNTHTSEMRDFAANPKLNDDKVWEILNLFYFDEVSGRELARRFQVSQPMIRFILKGSSWKTVYDKFVAEFPQVLID